MAEASAPPRVVVTGPTGWIGSALLDGLARRFGAGWDRQVSLFGSSERRVTAPDGAALPMRALSALRPDDLDGAIVVHLAYLTKEKVDQLGERQFSDTNLAIDDHLLAALGKARPRSLFVASSGAAKLAEQGQDRHPYGLGKLRQEDRFLAWAAASGVPLIAGRIFNVAGPHINKLGSYAIAVFIDQARRDGMIRIEARVPVFRSFLHVSDLCRLIIEAGINRIGRSRAIDLCGYEILEMSDIADAVARLIDGRVEVEREGVDWSRPKAYLGDFVDTKVLAMETGVPLAPFLVQVADTARWMEVACRG